MYVFGLAVACVFLALAALYESWSLPLAVILVVPLCLLCSVLGVQYLNAKDNSVNIFVQIGLVVLVGLACKNSILIVEFAKRLRERGQSRYEATKEASRLRLRPILMTSFAFILGVVPLVLASGAGAEMRRSLGTAVFSGMLGVTLFGIFLTPVFFYVIDGLSETRLFMAVATQWIGSVLMGALLGAGIGFSLSRLGLVDPTWAVPAGGCAGVLAALLFQTIWHIHERRQNGQSTPSAKDDNAACRPRKRRSTAMISHFFIDRPIFASVLSIVFVLAGGVAVFTLPVAQYPEVTPPTVLVTAIYPGANAQTVRDTVAAPIEEQVSGVEGMMYMSSQSTNDGTYRLSVTFKLGMDSDMAQVLVQNRVSLALPVIPQLVQNEGITVKKISPNTLMIVNLISPDNRYDDIFLSNYATIYIRDELGRLPGVADVTYFGQRDYSLRAWLDPDKLAALNLSAHRRGDRHRPAERAGRRRPNRPGAGSQGPAIPTDHQHPGPAGRSRAVRRHHRQGRPEQHRDAGAAGRHRPVGAGRHGRPGRPTAGQSSVQHARHAAAAVDRHRPAARRGPRRPRIATVRPVLHPGRPALGGAEHLPTSRLQRLGYGRARCMPR